MDRLIKLTGEPEKVFIPPERHPKHQDHNKYRKHG